MLKVFLHYQITQTIFFFVFGFITHAQKQAVPFSKDEMDKAMPF